MAAARSPARRSPSAKKASRSRHVFLSYASQDKEPAHQVANELRNAGFEPWLDEQQLQPGENWSQAIGHALETSDAIVLIVSKAFLKSPRLIEEWNFAIGSKKHAGRVLPIVAPDAPDESVPWILKRLRHVKAGSDWRRTGRRAADLLREIERSS